MKFSFMTKGGNEYVLDLDPSASIHDAKQFFQIIYSLNSEKITIIYHNRILSDSETLSNFIDTTFPGLFIISDEINDLYEEIEFDENHLSPIVDIKLNSKPKITSKACKKYTFHRLSNTEASQSNLTSFNNPKISQLSKFYSDNFTSFKVVMININVLNSYENFNSIKTNMITTEFSKTIGEALKMTVKMNSSHELNSLDNYFIIRSKTKMAQHSRLYEYNLHSSSTIFFNVESFLPKRVNLIVFCADKKVNRKISYNVYQDMSILDFKKIVAKDFFEYKEPYYIYLFNSQKQCLIDDRKIIDYNFINNANIEVTNSDLKNTTVMVILERPSICVALNLQTRISVYQMKQHIAKKIGIDSDQQIIIFKHKIITNEYQQKLYRLSLNKVFDIQVRTKWDPVYGVEFDTGVIYYFDVNDDQTILNLKIQIHDIMNIPISNICLIYNNKILDDKAAMSELSINYFSIITCKKQGFYENMVIKVKNTSLCVQQYASPHTYVSDISEIIKHQNFCTYDEKVSINIPILLIEQNTKMTQIEHCQETKFVLLEKMTNSFIITIKTCFNDIFYLPVYPEMTVRNVISLIQFLLNIDSQFSTGSIRLMWNGVILNEACTLAQYQIKPDYIIDAYLYPF